MEYSFINDPVLRGKLEKASKLNIGNIETINENKLKKMNQFQMEILLKREDQNLIKNLKV